MSQTRTYRKGREGERNRKFASALNVGDDYTRFDSFILLLAERLNAGRHQTLKGCQPIMSQTQRPPRKGRRRVA
jgi:hypothetical protein